MTARVLDDSDVKRLITIGEAVEVMRGSFLQHAAGRLQAPARIGTEMDLGHLVFTAGAMSGPPGRIGFRVYDLTQLGVAGRTELVAVFSTVEGSLEGLVVGEALGPLRTGAIGGLAIDVLSRPASCRLGLIGTGAQARTQIAAACAVRTFTSIRAYSRDQSRRQSFCREMSKQLEVEVESVASAREAVEEADVLICSSTSNQPVIETDWIAPGTHVQNVGPKFQDNSELTVDLYHRAEVLVTDAPAQLAAVADRFLVAGTPTVDRIETLSQVLAGEAEGRKTGEQISLFCSMGLAGTEVALAGELLERAGN